MLRASFPSAHELPASNGRMIGTRSIRLAHPWPDASHARPALHAQDAAPPTASRTSSLARMNRWFAAKAGKILHAFRIAGNGAPSIDGTLDDDVWAPRPKRRRLRAVGSGQRPARERTHADSGRPTTIGSSTSRSAVSIGRPARSHAGSPAATTARRPTRSRSSSIPVTITRPAICSRPTRPACRPTTTTTMTTGSTSASMRSGKCARRSTRRAGWPNSAIPFSQMRFDASPGAGQVWGLSSRRVIRRRSEFGGLDWPAARRARRGVALGPPRLRRRADAAAAASRSCRIRSLAPSGRRAPPAPDSRAPSAPICASASAPRRRSRRR